MAGFNLDKYREMFEQEAQEQFEAIEALLLEAERNETLSADEMQELFRAMHTLKGGGASVEFARFAEFTHEIETFLDKLRNGLIVYQPEMADFLIDCSDAMKELLGLELIGEPEPSEVQSLTHELIATAQNYIHASADSTHKHEVPESENVRQEPAAPAAPASKESQETFNGAFGFFDEPEEITAPPVSEPFGFFGDEIKKPDETNSTQEYEGFGFFDDIDLSKTPPKPPKEELLEFDGFGFFETPVTITKQELEQTPAPQNEGFRFFDDVLTPRPVQSTANPQPAAPVLPSEQKPAPVTPGHSSVPVSKPKPKKEAESPSDSRQPKEKKTQSTIRVDLSKIDTLMNNIGELVITTSMLYPLAESLTEKKKKNEMLEKLDLLERHIRELQESVMTVRMVPMEDIYAKFPKIIRDTAKKVAKKVEFIHTGDSVEIDKAMIEGITDPIMHIVRNSIDHGLEIPEERSKLGKPESGTVRMSADSANGQIIIAISDDGRGIPLDKVVQKALDREIITPEKLESMNDDDKAALIFEAGLSTAKEITDVSGRGVGMDVVRSNISKLGGSVQISTEPGVGTTITIVLPLTLAILDGLNIGVGETRFILPLASIVESLQPKEDMIKRVGDRSEELLMLREEFIPIVRLHKIFDVTPHYTELEKGMLIVVRTGNSKVALFVDIFLNQQQIVVKPLDKNFRNIQGVGGATVRGDGSIGLILDVMGIVQKYKSVRMGAVA